MCGYFKLISRINQAVEQRATSTPMLNHAVRLREGATAVSSHLFSFLFIHSSVDATLYRFWTRARRLAWLLTIFLRCLPICNNLHSYTYACNSRTSCTYMCNRNTRIYVPHESIWTLTIKSSDVRIRCIKNFEISLTLRIMITLAKLQTNHKNVLCIIEITRYLLQACI